MSEMGSKELFLWW